MQIYVRIIRSWSVDAMKPTAHSHCHPPSKLTHSAGCCCESMLQMSWAHSSISKQSIPLSLWNPEAHSQVKLPSVLRQLVTGFPCVVIRKNARKLFIDSRFKYSGFFSFQSVSGNCVQCQEIDACVKMSEMDWKMPENIRHVSIPKFLRDIRNLEILDFNFRKFSDIFTLFGQFFDIFVLWPNHFLTFLRFVLNFPTFLPTSRIFK